MMPDRTHRPDIHRLDSIEVLRPEQYTLPNGTLLNVIHAGEQDVVRMDILFHAGVLNQTQKLQALFTHRMLREGSGRYTSADISEKLDYYGSWLELSNSLEYAYITSYSLNKYFPQTLDIIESIVKEPTFPENELNTIVATNLQRHLINRTKVNFMAHRAMLKSLFGEQNPCGQFAGEADYHLIDTQLLKDFYNRYYHTGRYSVFLSGKVTDEIIRRVEQVFGVGTFGNAEVIDSEQTYTVDPTPEKRIFIEREDTMQSAVQLGWFTINHSHPDYLKLRVLKTLFGGYFGSRLMSNIREDKGYTYSISMGTLQYPGHAVMAVTTETANEYVEPLIREIYNEMDIIRRELVSPEELDVVKNYMLGEICRNCESPFSLSDAWMFICTTGLDEDYYERSVEAIKSVTATEIRDLACRYICKESLKEIVAGKKMS